MDRVVDLDRDPGLPEELEAGRHDVRAQVREVDRVGIVEHRHVRVADDEKERDTGRRRRLVGRGVEVPHFLRLDRLTELDANRGRRIDALLVVARNDPDLVLVDLRETEDLRGNRVGAHGRGEGGLSDERLAAEIQYRRRDDDPNQFPGRKGLEGPEIVVGVGYEDEHVRCDEFLVVREAAWKTVRARVEDLDVALRVGRHGPGQLQVEGGRREVVVVREAPDEGSTRHDSRVFGQRIVLDHLQCAAQAGIRLIRGPIGQDRPRVEVVAELQQEILVAGVPVRQRGRGRPGRQRQDLVLLRDVGLQDGLGRHVQDLLRRVAELVGLGDPVRIELPQAGRAERQLERADVVRTAGRTPAAAGRPEHREEGDDLDMSHEDILHACTEASRTWLTGANSRRAP